MATSAPKQITWWIALIIGLLGIIIYFGVIPALTAYAFWLVVVALVILLIATMVDGV